MSFRCEDRPSVGSVESPRSSANTPCSSPTCCCIRPLLLGFGIIDWGVATSRTVSIECRMQVSIETFILLYRCSNSVSFDAPSSALGFLLAQKHFTNPLVAVSSAFSAVCIAVFWRSRPIPVDD
ncbi:hypothetical protein GQ457_16G004030 [Hibiscus cannabinus]